MENLVEIWLENWLENLLENLLEMLVENLLVNGCEIIGEKIVATNLPLRLVTTIIYMRYEIN